MTEYEIRLTIKDEMKNRISMALKDPILQQCFEIICKENAELKVRNAELKGMYVHSAREAGTYKQFLEAKEKENAELKERIKTLEQIKQEHTNYTIKVEEERTFVKEQLTKAKEIIKAFLDSSDLNIKHKAEEFLGEF